MILEPLERRRLFSAASLATVPSNELDVDFGEHGQVVVDFAGFKDFAHAIAVQPDEKLVVAGFALLNEQRDGAAAVARF